MSEFAVTVVGADRPGIIAAITSVLADLGGNLEDSSMTILRGHFAMTLIVATDRVAPDVHEALDSVCRNLGVRATVAAVEPVPDHSGAALSYVMSVHGADRPGIVAAVTAVVAGRGGNITDLTTRLTEDLYVLTCEVDLPVGTDIDALHTELTAVAGELGVDVSMRPVDDELL